MYRNPLLSALIIFTAVATCLCPGDVARSQDVEMPASRIGKVLESWLKFMDASDDSPANKFNPSGYLDKTNSSIRSRTEFRNHARELFGKLTLGKVVTEKDRELTVVLKGKDNQELLVTIYLSPKPDDLIDAVMIQPYRGDATTRQPTQQSDAEVKASLSKLMVRAAKQGFSGTVLLARGSEPLFVEAFGLANRSYNIANTIDTKFNLGSMNKMFTAVAIMQLVEKNKLSLTDPISNYLDETWLPEKVTGRIQIRHLLSHTSGLGSYFNEQFRDGARANFRHLDDYKPLLANEQLAFDPGTQWQYSNTGFLLLGAIVEKVTGETYYDYVRANIFARANMSASDSFEMDSPTENLAYGYWQDAGRWKNNLFMHVIKGGPAGGGFSTVKDLLRFSVALTSGRLLTPESARTMVAPKPESPRYGFGFEVQKSRAGLVVGHSGGFPGIEANLSIFLDQGVTLVILCNAEDSMGLVLDDIRSIVSSMHN